VSTFAGKVALVTGGTRGLGLAAAHAFVRRGARVVITARSHNQGQQAAAELRRAGGEAHFIPGDLADPATPERGRVERTPPVCRSALYALFLPPFGSGRVTVFDHAPLCASPSQKPACGFPAQAFSDGP